MLVYPILEWYYNLIMGLPSSIWAWCMGFILIRGILKLFGIKSFLIDMFWIIPSIVIVPFVLFVICDTCKLLQAIPIIGLLGIIFRVGVDISIVFGVIMIIRYIKEL